MSHLSWQDNIGWTSTCLKEQFYLHGSKERELLSDLDSEIMLSINMLSTLPSDEEMRNLAGFCVNSIWKVTPSLTENLQRGEASCEIMSHKACLCLQKISMHLPAVKSIKTWSHLQAGFGWLHRMSDKCSITFEYPVSSMPYINFLIFWMLLLTWVLWHPNPQASVTRGSQSVVLQDQLRHGSLIRLKFISMVLALSFSKAGEQNYSRLSATTSSIW